MRRGHGAVSKSHVMSGEQPDSRRKILWICALPLGVQRAMLAGEDHGAQVAMSWILAHLPPPPEVELHIACLWPGGSRRKDFIFEGAHFHLVPCPRRGRALLLFQRDHRYFRALYEEVQPAVVHGWGTEDSFGLVARRLAPRSHLIGIQGLITAYRARVPMEARTRLTEITERFTLRKARWVVAESGYSQRAAAPLAPRAKMRVIEHPLRPEFLQASPCDPESRRILFLGGVSDRKGIRDAVQAFARLPDQSWTLQVIGSGLLESEASMHQLVRELGVEARFQHATSMPLPELVAAMQQSAIFLLPTRIDTGPTALKEALALGLWPVCYDNTGPGEYLREFRFGSLACDGDLTDLSRKLLKATETRPWKEGTLREEALTKAHDLFSRERIWRELRALYSEILQERDTAGVIH